MKTDKNICLDLDSTLIYYVPEIVRDDPIYKKLKGDEIDMIKEEDYDSIAETENVRKFTFIDSNDKCPSEGLSHNRCVVVIRPYMKEFLVWAIGYFDKIYVWTAGHRRYGMSIMNILFQELLEEVYPGTTQDVNDYVTSYYSRKDCEIRTAVGEDEKGRKYEYDDVTKDIAKKGFDKKLTMCLDDNPDTFKKNKGNGFLIPRYEPNFGDNNDVMNDDALLQFMNWCNQDKVRNGEDVPRMKNKVFSSK